MAEAPTDAPVIDTLGLAKRYGHADALIDLTLRVEPGEVFGFLGPNGAGKTTAVKLLLGLARATGGSGTVLGAPLGDRRARREIGYLPELFRYQPWLRAREVVELHRRLRAVDGGGSASRSRSASGSGSAKPSTSGSRSASPSGSPKSSASRAPKSSGSGSASADEVAAALELVGLADRADDTVGGFSKGMQQRLGLAVALLGAPRLVILDEPTSALDPVGRRDVRSIVRQAADAGSTIFLNSHLLTEVERVCDRVAIVDHGRVLASGRIDDLLGESSVRVRVTDLAAADVADLRRFGRVAVTEDGWFSIAGLDPERVPDVVAAIVSVGGR